MTGRNFTASLKPAWNTEKINKILQDLTGTATVWVINHDKDIDTKTGELIENHTHILLEYETPRKIGTVANLLEVEPNFVELVKSKKALVRYLTHKDDADKYQYDDHEVMTNSSIAYADYVMGSNLSDKEIAQYIAEGRGMDLMGVVSVTKLRTIQAFLQFDRTGSMQREITLMRNRLESMGTALDNINAIATDFQMAAARGLTSMNDAMIRIADEIAKVNKARTITNQKR